MPLSRASTVHSLASDVDSLDAAPIVSTEHRIIEITSQPDFCIFTSMLWVRRPSQDFQTDHFVKESCGSPSCMTGLVKVAAPDQSQADLGLLSYHRDRLADAARALGWRHIYAIERSDDGLKNLRSSIELYLQCLSPLPSDRIERRKLRLMISKLGMIKIDSTVIDCPLASDLVLNPAMLVPQSLNFLIGSDVQTGMDREPMQDHKFSQIFLDSQPTHASLFTTHKTSNRGQYNRARMRAKITVSPPTDKEVLIYNKNGEIMEASLSTVYFHRAGKWVTPAAICGGNLGVTRRLALEMDLCTQGIVEISEIEDGEMIWLSNGARGFFVGQIRLERHKPPSISECGASP